jgi:hypothetical protein
LGDRRPPMLLRCWAPPPQKTARQCRTTQQSNEQSGIRETRRASVRCAALHALLGDSPNPAIKPAKPRRVTLGDDRPAGCRQGREPGCRSVKIDRTEFGFPVAGSATRRSARPEPPISANSHFSRHQSPERIRPDSVHPPCSDRRRSGHRIASTVTARERFSGASGDAPADTEGDAVLARLPGPAGPLTSSPGPRAVRGDSRRPRVIACRRPPPGEGNRSRRRAAPWGHVCDRHEAVPPSGHLGGCLG